MRLLRGGQSESVDAFAHCSCRDRDVQCAQRAFGGRIVGDHAAVAQPVPPHRHACLLWLALLDHVRSVLRGNFLHRPAGFQRMDARPSVRRTGVLDRRSSEGFRPRLGAKRTQGSTRVLEFYVARVVERYSPDDEFN